MMTKWSGNYTNQWPHSLLHLSLTPRWKKIKINNFKVWLAALSIISVDSGQTGCEWIGSHLALHIFQDTIHYFPRKGTWKTESGPTQVWFTETVSFLQYQGHVFLGLGSAKANHAIRSKLLFQQNLTHQFRGSSDKGYTSRCKWFRAKTNGHSWAIGSEPLPLVSCLNELQNTTIPKLGVWGVCV